MINFGKMAKKNRKSIFLTQENNLVTISIREQLNGIFKDVA